MTAAGRTTGVRRSKSAWWMTSTSSGGRRLRLNSVKAATVHSGSSEGWKRLSEHVTFSFLHLLITPTKCPFLSISKSNTHTVNKFVVTPHVNKHYVGNAGYWYCMYIWSSQICFLKHCEMSIPVCLKLSTFWPFDNFARSKNYGITDLDGRLLFRF